MYGIELHKGISSPICGWDWIADHKDFPYPHLTFEIITPGSRQSVTLKNDKLLDKILKEINR